MRGRMQASAVALLGSLVPLISPASVALVALRKGYQESLLIALWALLPPLILYYSSGLNAIVAFASVAGILMVVLAAEILRVSRSWRHALLLTSAGGGVCAIVLSQVFSGELTALQEAIAKMLADIQQQQGRQAAQGFVPGETFITGLLAYIVALSTLCALLLARWWQAMLYNPGGFREEFHQLRLDNKEALILLAGVVFCQFSSVEYFSWSELFALPLLLSGIALVHFTVAHRKMGVHWLVIFYVGLVTIAPLSLGLSVIGFVDSFLNFRARMAAKSGQ